MLTHRQNQKYWRIWAEIVACDLEVQQMTSRQKTEFRHGLHKKFGLPEKHQGWNNQQFNRWITRTAERRNTIDIRDRDRENVVWTVEKLQAAFLTLLGSDYARALMVDFRDTVDLEKFPLEDPLQFLRDEKGNIDPRDQGRMRDLVNLRNTLKNRLGRVIQRLRDGQLTPGPDCPQFFDRSQEEIIHCLTYGNPITPRPAQAPAPAKEKRRFVLDDSRTFQDRGGMEHGTADVAAPARPAAPVPHPRTKATPAPAPAPTAPVKPPQTGGKYCMH